MKNFNCAVKRYISTHLPGDVALANDGSIGLIVKVSIITSRGRHADWNFMHGGNALQEGERVVGERYAMDAIPGYPISKLAWWTLSDFKQVLAGPLHKVLNGEEAGGFAPRIGGFGPGSAPRLELNESIPPAVCDAIEKVADQAEKFEISPFAGPGGLSSVAPFGRPWYKRK